ncbi:MAG TPA: DUF3592 domain-containing protein [Kiritimatiellia bacterium]|nr:DUF3592 domain-containing protein [Kiritimatiellia bacterium]
MQDAQPAGSYLALIFLVPAAFLWALAARDIRKMLRMRAWPRVDGVIREVRTRPKTRHSVAVDVKMDFMWEGRERSIWCGSPTRAGFSTKTAADQTALNKRVREYVPGSTRSVIVNPEQPDEAFIRMPEWHIIIACIIGGLLLAAIAILSAFFIPAT